MEQRKPLMEQARGAAAMPQEEEGSGQFERPDIEEFIPEEAKDAVARVVAAGIKLMTSPQMRDDVQQEIERDAPMPQKLAEATTGLMLTLDKQSQGGIPMAALFPSAMELLGEAAEVMTAAGQSVTQADYNEAAQMMFVMIGKRVGATEEQMMGAAEQALGQGGAQEGAEPSPGGEDEPPEQEEPPAEEEESMT